MPQNRPDRTRFGLQGACATTHPLAEEVGIHMLRQGGTAADAAVAMAAALTVLEPSNNGIGGDVFALTWDGSKLHGLNGSGRAPALMSLEGLRAAGHRDIPVRGWWSVTVPGAPRAWRDMNERFGRLPLRDVLRPAISLAEDGHPVLGTVSSGWERQIRMFQRFRDPVFHPWLQTFAPEGRAPGPGEIVRFPDHATTLRRIAESNAEDFYRGELSRRIERFSAESGGLLRAGDLDAHTGDWVDPIAGEYRDVTVWEMPPNGQGVVALAALRILAGFPPAPDWDDPESVHRAIEAVKLGFADAQAHVADPAFMRIDSSALLEEDYVASRRTAIGSRAEIRATGLPARGGTVFLAAADRDGMMVSFIQSNFMGSGSGVVVPGTGIALQNRGFGFSADPEHPNRMAPGRRPFSTIIPGFLFRHGRPWGPFGVMGGHMQPQGHVQVVQGLVDHRMSPHRVLDLPRWRWEEDLTVRMETGWPRRTTDWLKARGHEIRRTSTAFYGRGQIILRDRAGVLAVGSEPRAGGGGTVF